MAKTIGKDKASLTRARAADAEAEPVGDRTNDEPRDEDMVEAQGDGDLALAVATKAPAGAVDDEDVDEEDDRSLVLSSDAGALARGVPAPGTHRGMHTPGWMMGNAFTRPIAESIEELLKVTWPTWGEAWTMTIVVIVMSAVVAAILGVADIGLIRALAWIVSLGTSAPATH
ncbi:MAG TPA: preprotein translocase subunit SecE [Ktedonobacterales bacterium]|nr:preprotein translocase subunit SecE [Ktedonobacterales bacterium]